MDLIDNEASICYIFFFINNKEDFMLRIAPTYKHKISTSLSLLSNCNSNN